MKDSFGRNVNYLRLSLTPRCNLRCVYCRPARDAAAPAAPLLGDAEVARVAAAAADLGVVKIRLTGGEPLLRPDFPALCARIREAARPRILAVTTNGILLGRHAAALGPAGVTRVNVSVDSADPARYRKITRGGDLGAAVAGLRALAAAGCPEIRINAVLIRDFNDDPASLAGLMALARECGADLRFIELMPAAGNGLPPDRRSPAARVLAMLKDLYGAEEIPGEEGTARLCRIPGQPGRAGVIAPVSRSFCASCGRVRVTADGRVLTCLFAPDGPSLRGLTREEMRGVIARAVAARPATLFPRGRDARGGGNMSETGG